MSRIINRSKRVAAIILALAMVFALSANAFAAEQTTVTAYLRLQSATAPDNWDYTLGGLEDVSNITNGFVPVTVTKNGPVTVKDLLEALPGFTLVACPACDEYGCNPALCDCDECNCTWKKVANKVYDPATGSYVEDGNYASVLNSVQYNNTTYTNEAYTEVYDENHGYYEGTSWEYFVANCNSATAMYSTVDYMNQCIIDNSAYITISFDTSSFEW